MTLRQTTKTALALTTIMAALALVYLLLGSMKPTSAALQSHTIEVDLTTIPPGETRIVQVNGSMIQVTHRTEEDLANLNRISSQVRDPYSSKSKQPQYAANQYRSIKPEWFVSFAYENHRGSPVSYINQLPKGHEGQTKWFGGFYEALDGAIFDKAGRVYQGSGHPEQTNLPIPEHRYLNDTTIAIYPFGHV